MRIAIILVTLLLTVGCKSSSTKANNPENQQSVNVNHEKEIVNTNCKELLNLKKFEDSTIYSSTNIINYKVDDNCICIKYNYSGCNESEALLVWNGQYQKKISPEIKLNLWVKNAGYCDMLLTDSACFSLSSLQSFGSGFSVQLNRSQNQFKVD